MLKFSINFEYLVYCQKRHNNNLSRNWGQNVVSLIKNRIFHLHDAPIDHIKTFKPSA